MKHLLYIAGLAAAVLMGPGPVHSQTLPSAEPIIDRGAPRQTLPAPPPHITRSPPQLTLTHGPSCCYETRPGHFQTTVNTITVTNAGRGRAHDVTLVVSHVTREGENGPFNIPDVIAAYKGAFVDLALPQPTPIVPTCYPAFVDGAWTRRRCTYPVDLQMGEQLQVRFRWGGCPRREPRRARFAATIQATTYGDSGRGLHTFTYTHDTTLC